MHKTRVDLKFVSLTLYIDEFQSNEQFKVTMAIIDKHE